MKTKIKYSLLALLMVVSTIISTVSIANPALASPADTAPIDDQAKAFLYYRALTACFANASAKSPISTTDVVSGSWFNTGTGVSIGYIGSSEGLVNCDDAGFISSAVQLYGYTGKLEAYCDIMKGAGVSRVDKSECTGPSTSDLKIDQTADKVTSVKKAIEIKYFGGAGNHGDPGYLSYYIGIKQFEARCADRVKPFSQATTDEKSTGLSVTIVNDLGVKEAWLYKTKPDVNLSDTSMATFGQEDGQGYNPYCNKPSDATNSIKDNLIDKNIDAYVTWFATHKPVSCLDQYKGVPADLAACDAGFKNKTDAAFCNKTYPSNPDQSPGNVACVFGREKAAGGADGTIVAPAAGGAKDTTSCVVDGIGWILCPVVDFMAKIVDAAYTVVSALLTIQPVLWTGDNTTIYDTWGVMRNFANVAFVIVFLIIIFSQITSFGVSNYGIKKMLPRLVAAAILVNISFWICSIAVDVSNIVGTSVYGVFKNINANIAPVSAQFSSGATGKGWSGIAGGVLAGVAVGVGALFVGLSALLPALIIALIAIVTVFIVLTVRQALVVLLIVISPLAFVAFLLPNTESMFKKWRSLLQTMLLMYPIIGLVFGAASLASTVIMTTVPAGTKEGLKLAIQVMGALVSIIPLALTPLIMKAAGGVLGKVGAFVNNPNRGPFDRMKKGAANFKADSKNSRGIRAMNGGPSMIGRAGAIRRRNKINAQRSGRDEQFKHLQNEEILKEAVTNRDFAKSVAGQNATGYQARAQAQLNKIDKEKIENEEFLLKARLAPDQLVDGAVKALRDSVAIANDSTKSESVREEASTKARAATSILANQTGAKGLSKLRNTFTDTIDPATGAIVPAINPTGAVGESIRRDISNSNLKGRDAGMDAWSRDTQNTKLDETSGKAGTWGGLSHEQIAGQTADAITAAGNSGGISAETATAVLANEKLNSTIGTDGKKALQAIANSATPSPTPPGPVPGTNPPPSNTPTVRTGPAPTPAPTPSNPYTVPTAPPTVATAPAPTTTPIWPGATVRTRP
ncbi:MAG: hypothetical protein ABIQ04_04470 [Candidatus Saccharimonadales bacterium]